MSRIETDVADHLAWLAAHGYAITTLANRARHLGGLVSYLAGLGVSATGTVGFSDLEGYQLHLHLYRKRDGEPLSFRTQSQRLIPVKVFFSWAARAGRIALDPAAGLVLPRVEHRLPEATLTAGEAEAVLAIPDVTVPLGLRDRAIMEVLYSSAIRRAELIALRVHDIDHARRTLFVRQGKGRRDRHVPIGERALSWVDRYEAAVRPHLASSPDHGLLFLSVGSGPLCADWLSRTVGAYVSAGVPDKHGSCHLFRHTAATLLLEGGADIRYVAEILGHQKLETTKIYTRVSIDKLRQVHAACHPAERSRPPQVAPLISRW